MDSNPRCPLASLTPYGRWAKPAHGCRSPMVSPTVMANGEMVHARPPVAMDSAVPLMRPPPTDVADENEKEQSCYLALLQRPRPAIHIYLAGQRFQHARELLSAQKTSHNNNKDVSRLRFSPGICVNTRYINSTRGTSSGTQILRGRGTADVPLVEFMYLVFTHMPSECRRRRLRPLLLCLCDISSAD